MKTYCYFLVVLFVIASLACTLSVYAGTRLGEGRSRSRTGALQAGARLGGASILRSTATAKDESRSPEPIFIPVKIDGPAHDPANHSYWFGPFCECASVLDVDGDGDLDIASGRNWYEAPNPSTPFDSARDGEPVEPLDQARELS